MMKWLNTKIRSSVERRKLRKAETLTVHFPENLDGFLFYPSTIYQSKRISIIQDWANRIVIIEPTQITYCRTKATAKPVILEAFYRLVEPSNPAVPISKLK